MATASLQAFLSAPNPNPKPSSRSIAAYSVSRRSIPVCGGVSWSRRLGTPRRGLRGLPPLALPGDDSTSDFELRNAKDINEAEKESEQAWSQVLDSFKEQALKMQSLSQEAYEVYSKKAMIVLEETRKNMKIQADQASRDIAIIAKEISEEGRGYISAASENSPESVKDIVEVFSAPPEDLKDISKFNDFHVGIPYGAVLALGGFASFMFTGSTSAIRFGIILGGSLLALSSASLREWKKGKTSSLLLKSQAAIAMIIFIREFRLLIQKQSLPASFMTIFSGAVLAFYIYRVVLFRQSKGQSLEYGSED